MEIEFVSHIRRLCEKKGISYFDFKLKFQDMAKASESTAKRIWDGQTSTSTEHFLIVAKIVGANVEELIEMRIRK